jgi:hypothetical protein
MTAPILPAAFSPPPHGDPAKTACAPGGLRPLSGFVAGTRMATPMGYVAVERLAAGDLILTADGRHARIDGVSMQDGVAQTAQTAPVCFAAGQIDNMRPLRLAQGQCLRLTGWRAQRFFDAEAVLVPARAFVDGISVVIDEQPGALRYFNLIFPDHEVILAENVACAALCLDAHDPPRKGHMTDGAAALSQTAGMRDLPVVSYAEARLLLAA